MPKSTPIVIKEIASSSVSFLVVIRNLRILRLGVTELTAMTRLPNLIQRIRGNHPTLALEPVVDASVQLIEKLKADELDAVVVPDAFREAPFEIVPLDSVEYAWMCSPACFDDVSELPLASMANHTIIVQRQASSGLGDLAASRAAPLPSHP